MRSQVPRNKLSATDVRTLQTLLLASVFEQGSIGRRIAQARREAGLTQDELSDLVGVSMRTIQNWEGGDTSAYRHMRQIAEVTGRSLKWLLHGEDDESSDDDRLTLLQGEVSEIREMLARVLEARAEPAEQEPRQQAEEL